MLGSTLPILATNIIKDFIQNGLIYYQIRSEEF